MDPLPSSGGRFRHRLSIAALTRYKPGERSRLIYRPRREDRPDGHRSFAWNDDRDLLKVAHLRLGGPIVLVWADLNTHKTAGPRRFIAARDWLTVYHLPAHAPDLNPVEGVWSLLRRGPLANRAFTDPDDLFRTVRRGLREIRYRPSLIDAVLVETGLVIGAPP